MTKEFDESLPEGINAVREVGAGQWAVGLTLFVHASTAAEAADLGKKFRDVICTPHDSDNIGAKLDALPFEWRLAAPYWC